MEGNEIEGREGEAPNEVIPGTPFCGLSIDPLRAWERVTAGNKAESAVGLP
jgi:hypothetical protein